MKYYTYEQLRNNQQLYTNCSKLVPLICEHCGTKFQRPKKDVSTSIQRCTKTFCSLKCKSSYQTANGRSIITCFQCGKDRSRTNSKILSSHGNTFCSSSCAATYNNTHKTYGIRRSKIEMFLEEELYKSHNSLEIYYNRTNIINFELDIYIPKINTAFEINGIFHYKPIYGEKHLNKVQNNDMKKKELCDENNITLYIIDITHIKNFNLKQAKEIFQHISKIINNKLSQLNQPWPVYSPL